MSQLNKKRIIKIGASTIGCLIVLGGGYIIWQWQATPSYTDGCETQKIDPQETALSNFISDKSPRIAVSVSCHSPQRGDLVAFESKLRRNLVVRKVAAVPGDTLSVNDNRSVSVNKQTVKYPNGNVYTLKGKRLQTIRKYTGQVNGYILIGEKNSFDSSKFGTISKSSLKYVIPKEAL